MSSLLFRLAAIPALLVCASCYTNINQVWFNKQYSGYRLDYHTNAEAGVYGLPPVLYRCGEDWYIAGILSHVQDRDMHLHRIQERYDQRHRFVLTAQTGRPLRYHKITPEMAAWLLRSDQESFAWFTSAKVREELEKAGGDWLENLPPGAKSVPAGFLKLGKAQARHVMELDTPSPWYAYPMAGLTFLCVDVPCSAVASVLALSLMVIDSALEDDEEEQARKEAQKDDTPPYDASPHTTWEYPT